MHPMLTIAVRAARTAGNVIVRSLERINDIQIFEKNQNDYVTEVDRLAESKIIHTIQKSYPDHRIIAEESGETGSDDNYTWVIDPLDGTTNFMHGFPHFAVSIAVKSKHRYEHAVVYDPIRQDLFTASRGQGAYLNDKRIRVSQRIALHGALIGTGFPYRQHQEIDLYLETFKAIFTKAAGIRRAGSAALDLAYVAAGHLDGFWEFGLKEWDMAAGVLLIKEAGGLISDINGWENYLETGSIVAGNPKVFKLLLQSITPALKAVEK